MKAFGLKLFFGVLIILVIIQSLNGQSNNDKQLKLIGKWLQDENEDIIIEFTQTTFTDHKGNVENYIIENDAIILILEGGILNDVPFEITNFSARMQIAESFEFIDDNTLKLIGGSNYFRIYKRLK
jgi:recombinational DNA repair protein RecR